VHCNHCIALGHEESNLRTSTSTIKINAPATRVWEALTNPELVKLWQYGSTLTTTWEPGSPIRFRAAWNDQVFEQWGHVMEYSPNNSLKYSLFAPQPGLTDCPENYFFMTYRLEEAHGKTTLSIIQDDPRPGNQLEAQQENEEETESPILLGLKALVEKI
jgi:uncharacterized protein YndB with AHSA1/START domain